MANILNANNLDEIVFASRNREYGAYHLRKKYKRNVIIALLCGTFLMVSTVGLPYLMAVADAKKRTIEKVVEVKMTDIKTTTEEPPPPPPPPPPSAALQQAVRFTAPQVVDTVVDEKSQLSDVEDLANQVGGEDLGDVTPEIVVAEKQEIQETKQEEIFIFVEEMPEYPGGDVELRKYIAQNVQYPAVARENNIQGKVFIHFAVTSEGLVDKVTVYRGVDPVLDEEAVRVVKTLPRWKPGKQRGKPVSVWYTVPINFTLQN